jgi:PAS domain-containing protein
MAAQATFLEIDKPGWLTQMEAMLEVLNEGVIVTNDRREVLFANSHFVEMTGIPSPNLIGSEQQSPQAGRRRRLRVVCNRMVAS